MNCLWRSIDKADVCRIQLLTLEQLWLYLMAETLALVGGIFAYNNFRSRNNLELCLSNKNIAV